MNRLITLFFCFSLTFIQPSYAQSPKDFPKAKQIALELFSKHPSTLYCHCQFNQSKDVDLASCHMQSAHSSKRAYEMEWEHMVPASHLGRGHACWTQDLCTNSHGHGYHGRKCCEHIDSAFKHKEAELFNLWPADGVINQLRQDYDYANLPHNDNTYGCDFSIDNHQHLVEPFGSAKGTVARASLFMEEHYDIELSHEQHEQFLEWSHLYPPSQWEKDWDQAVFKVEGYHNRFITEASSL